MSERASDLANERAGRKEGEREEGDRDGHGRLGAGEGAGFAKEERRGTSE